MRKNYFLVLLAILLTANGIAQNIPSYIPKDGLVGYWPFDGNANDVSGNGNHGTVNGATLTTDRNGVANSAYSFDGINNFIKCLNSNSLSLRGEDASFSIWLNRRGTCGAYLCKSEFGGLGIDYRIYSYDTRFDYLHNSVGYSNGEIVGNKWINLIVIQKSDTIKVYIDGILTMIDKISSTGYGRDENSDLYFGIDQHGSLEYLDGMLDDITIYNRAINETEVKTLYLGCPNETAISDNFTLPLYTTNTPISLTAAPIGGTFSGESIENNYFNPRNAKLGRNLIKYTFTNSFGCQDFTDFSMILVDTLGINCKKYDTITVTNSVTKYDTVTIKNNVYDTITVTNNVTKYDTVIVNKTKYDTITVTNNVTKYDTVIVNKTNYDTITVTNNVTKYDTVIVPKTVTKYDTVIVPKTITKYDTVKVNTYDTVIVPKTVTKYDTVKVNTYDTITVTNNVTKYDTVKVNTYDTITVTNNVTKYDTVIVPKTVTKYDTVKVNTYDTITVTNNVTKYDTVIVPKTVTKYDTVKINTYDTITVTNSVTKYDTITVTDTVSILKINFKLTTGIKANQMTSMSIYPNPTSDVLIIDASDLAAITGYSYRILDALGKEVYNALVTTAKTEISLKTLGAKGMYVLHILDANKQSVQTKQIILE